MLNSKKKIRKEESKIRIGERLVKDKLISSDQLERATKTSQKTGKLIGETLVEMGAITNDQLETSLDIAELGPLERYLALVVFIFIGIGIIVGKYFPDFVKIIDSLTIKDVVSIPIAMCLFFMMYPIMLKVDLGRIHEAFKNPKAVLITWITAWFIQPPVMFFLAWLFLKKIFVNYLTLEEATQFVSGIILVGIAPCTAMVLVWSYLAKGNLAHTVLMVAINTITILFIYAPIANFLLHMNAVKVPFITLLITVFMYVGISLIAGHFSRKLLIKKKGIEWLETIFLPKTQRISIIALLITLIVIFSSQGGLILRLPFKIAMIATPLLGNFIIVFLVTYFVFCKIFKIKYTDAAPSAIIASSNHFELGIATAISLFGISSNAALATVVVPLIEVPVMLTIVKICLKTRNIFHS